MDELDTPVLDNHIHLDPEHGRGIDAVRDFEHLGGTHLLVLNKPSWHLGPVPTERSDFRTAFEATIDAVTDANDILPGKAWPVLGVHPGLVSHLIDNGFTPEEAENLMQSGLDLAAKYVAHGRALALKTGRPHYEVSETVWNTSNEVLKHGLSLGAEHDCAVQLHTEGTNDLTDVAGWAEQRGLSVEKVVKHYALGELTGPIPSVMSKKDRLRTAAESGKPFLMETDFVDDPERPGMVLGPKTVPRRVRWLVAEGYDDAVARAHIETPKRVYEVDTEATLNRNA